MYLLNSSVQRLFQVALSHLIFQIHYEISWVPPQLYLEREGTEAVNLKQQAQGQISGTRQR